MSLVKFQQSVIYAYSGVLWTLGCEG